MQSFRVSHYLSLTHTHTPLSCTTACNYEASWSVLPSEFKAEHHSHTSITETDSCSDGATKKINEPVWFFRNRHLNQIPVVQHRTLRNTSSESTINGPFSQTTTITTTTVHRLMISGKSDSWLFLTETRDYHQLHTQKSNENITRLIWQHCCD